MWSNRSTSAANIVMAQVPLPHSFCFFHVWCFWWVSASYDYLKLNWFCLTGKGLPDIHMTQRIDIHILFGNWKPCKVFGMCSMCWIWVTWWSCPLERGCGWTSYVAHAKWSIGRHWWQGVSSNVVVARRSMLAGVIAEQRIQNASTSLCILEVYVC
jgi:hypothetical protein